MEQASSSAQNVTSAGTSPAGRPAPRRRLTRRARLALAGVVVLVGIGLVLQRRSSPPADAPADGLAGQVEPQADAARTPAAATPAPASTSASIAATSGAVAPAVVEPSRRTAAKSASPKAAKAPVAPSPKSLARIDDEAPRASAPDSVSAREAAEPAVAGPAASTSTATVEPPRVTITGCLEQRADADEFRLIDTDGIDAPKSRSWRTGFLKKRRAAVLLVDLPDSHALQTQVGKRIAATGLLTSHELKVSSLRVVAASCE